MEGKTLVICFIVMWVCESLVSQSFDNLIYIADNVFPINLLETPIQIRQVERNYTPFVGYSGKYSLIASNNQMLFTNGGDIIINKKSLAMKNSALATVKNHNRHNRGLVIRAISELNQYYAFMPYGNLRPEDFLIKPGEIYHSMIDLRGDDGNGEVLANGAHTSLGKKYENKYTYVVTCDGYWLVVKENNSPNIHAYKIDKNGLNSIPVTSSVGFQMNYAYDPLIVRSHEGSMTISSDKKTIAVSYGDLNSFFDLYDFNIYTGIVSNRREISLSKDMLWAADIQFSRNSKDLYLVENNLRDVQITRIKLDTNNKELSRSRLYLDTESWNDPNSFYRGASIRRIYPASDNQVYISVTDLLLKYDPNLNKIDTLISGIRKGQSSSTFTFYSLPQKVTYYPTILQKTSRDTFYKCKSDPVKLHLETPLRNVVWNNQFRQDTLEITQAGTYVVSGIDDYCTYFDTVHVVDRPEPPAFTKQFDVCANTTKAISLPTSFSSIYWPDDVNADRLRLFPKPGVYPFTARFDLCNIEDSITIKEKPKPVMLATDASRSLSLCPNTTLSSLTPLTNTTWNGSVQQDTLRVNQAATITLSGNYDGCLYVDTAFVTLKPINNFVNKTFALCDGKPVTINLTTALPNSTAVLDNQPPSPQWTFSTEGQYAYTLTSNGCTVRDTLTIRKQDISKNHLPDTTLCNNEKLAISLPTTYNNILWQDNLNTNLRTITQSGTYRYSAIEFGCVIRDTFLVTINDKVRPPLPIVLKLCLKDTLPTPKGLIWESVPSPIQAGTYQYTFTDSLGCEFNGQTEISIVSCEPCKPLLPNIIRSGDPVYIYFNCPTSSYDLLIYDRWGNTMHKSLGVIATNGTINLDSKSWADGVYTYYLRTSNVGEKDKTFGGSMVLVR